MFYSKPAMSLEEHQAVYDDIVERLTDEGFPPELSRLDSNCRSGVQSFYIPCTSRQHPGWALFETYGTKTAELARYAINPELVWKTAAPQEDVIYTPVSHSHTETTPDIEELIRQIQSMSCDRHALVWSLALKLATHFRDEGLVRMYLERMAGSDKKLRMKSRDAIKQLKRYGKL